MANSKFIENAKQEIIKRFIKNSDIVAAIDSSTVTKPQELIDTHIFTYNQDPNTLNTVETFITVQVSIPTPYYTEKFYVKPQVTIWIMSHEKHMKVTNVPKVRSNRNDYLSRLIDEELNGKNIAGITTLSLTSNVEGSFQKDYLYRQMTFQGADLNINICEE